MCVRVYVSSLRVTLFLFTNVAPYDSDMYFGIYSVQHCQLLFQRCFALGGLYTNISLRACVRPRKITENVFSKIFFVPEFSSVHILKTFSPVSVSPQFIYTFLTSTCYGRGWIKQKACLGVTVDRLVGVSRAVNKALPGLLLPSQRKRRTVPIVAIYSCVHFCYLGHGCFLPLVRKRYFIMSSQLFRLAG